MWVIIKNINNRDVFRTVVHKVWSQEQQHQYLMETCKKYKFSDPIQVILNQKLWGWNLGICFLITP